MTIRRSEGRPEVEEVGRDSGKWREIHENLVLSQKIFLKVFFFNILFILKNFFISLYI